MIIAHNMLAMNANRQLGIVTDSKKKSTEKLSSGYRINRSADDAAGLQISEKMRAQIRGLHRGMQNTMEGISWLQVADGAMGEMQDMITRIRELAVQASNDTNSVEDRQAIDEEISQLKKQLNQTALDTQFNAQDIFDNSYVMMDVDGDLDDLQIYDATYDDTTGEVTYGGFVYNGQRISWDRIDAGMVTYDATAGKQVFAKDGEYTYSVGGESFHFTCTAGTDVPKITRTIDISADADGIRIDGTRYDWSSLLDEDGEGFSGANAHSGTWSLEHKGATVAFFVGSNISNVSDMAEALNSCRAGKVVYSWQSIYAGSQMEQAVDAQVDSTKILRVSQGFVDSGKGTADPLIFTVRAGDGSNNTKDGIWLENSDGTEVTGSFKSWADLGILDWSNGPDISLLKYEYNDEDSDATNDTLISFEFTLSDVTSKDSVIDGLDGMELNANNVQTSYDTIVALDNTSAPNVKELTSSINNYVTFDEEVTLGRSFNDETQTEVAKDNIAYDETANAATLEVGKNNGTTAITYQGSTSAAEQSMTTDLGLYANYILSIKQAEALSGTTGSTTTPVPYTCLTDLVGTRNITADGYFSENLTITGAMKLTDGDVDYAPGRVGQTYPAAVIDFKELDSAAKLYNLEGLGFDSTCKTCSKHYSVVFTKGLVDDAAAAQTAGGYRYTVAEKGTEDYLLQIDIDSLVQNGVSDGAGLAAALVDITSQAFDFHFTQYAADGSKLYVYDDRTDMSRRTEATFGDKPQHSISEDTYDITVGTSGGRSIKLSYSYDYEDFADNIKVEMVADTSGGTSLDNLYIQNDDGTYVKYNAANAAHAGKPLYNMVTTYTKADGTTATRDEVISEYVSNAMTEMLENTNVQLNATNYTTMQIAGDENPNVAIKTVFQSVVTETPYENGLHIQSSGTVGDTLIIPRFAMNNMVLHLYKARTRNYEEAQATIDYALYAADYLSSKRSLYGAYYNRLEYTYNSRANMEENTQAAESRIRDADMAKEMVNNSKQNILEQVAQAMLAQSNQNTQGILSLLQ